MSNYEQPCSGLQVTQNEVKNVKHYIEFDIAAKIEDVRSDLKSDFKSTQTGTRIATELMRKNVEEQQKMRNTFSEVKKESEIAKNTSDRLLEFLKKFLFWFLTGIVAVFLGQVGLILTNLVNQKDTSRGMMHLNLTLEKQIQSEIAKQIHVFNERGE